MMHLMSRTDLILYVRDNAPLPAIARAIHEGEVEYYGVFDQVPGVFYSKVFGHTARILKVTSKHDRSWYVVVAPGQLPGETRVTLIDYVPWQRYQGFGDKPDRYRRFRDGVMGMERGIQPASQNDNELPGMWSHSDLAGGATDND